MSIYQNADKIVILGGTFDPVHNGHMQLAAKLYEVFKTKITFMPTGIPPHKAPPQASDKQRLEMLELALAANPNYQIDSREIDAGDFCYTYKTLNNLRAEVGMEVPVFFLLGGDSLLTLHTWHYWNTLLGLTNFVVAWRSGYSAAQIESAELAAAFAKHKTFDFTNVSRPYGQFYVLDFTPQNVSSTIIRQQVNSGLNISTLVPEAVAAYIKQQQLYLK